MTDRDRGLDTRKTRLQIPVSGRGSSSVAIDYRFRPVRNDYRYRLYHSVHSVPVTTTNPGSGGGSRRFGSLSGANRLQIPVHLLALKPWAGLKRNKLIVKSEAWTSLAGISSRIHPTDDYDFRLLKCPGRPYMRSIDYKAKCR